MMSKEIAAFLTATAVYRRAAVLFTWQSLFKRCTWLVERVVGLACCFSCAMLECAKARKKR